MSLDAKRFHIGRQVHPYMRKYAFTIFTIFTNNAPFLAQNSEFTNFRNPSSSSTAARGCAGERQMGVGGGEAPRDEGGGGEWVFRSEGASCEAFASTSAPVVVALRSKRRRPDRDACDVALEREIWGSDAEIHEHLAARDWFTRYIKASLPAPASAAVVVGRLRRIALGGAPPALALELPDVTQGAWALELKPKAATIPGPGAVMRASTAPLKTRYSRYFLQQRAKLASGRIRRISAYEPADLFAPEASRKRRALHALLADPQNNLTVWQGGRRVSLPAGFSAEDVAHWGAAALTAEQPTLDAILALQRRDTLGIEGIAHLYARLALRPPSGGGGEPDAAFAAATRTLDAMPREAAVAALRDYLIACSAKDCSVVVAFSQAEPGVRGGATDEEGGEGTPFHRMHVIDLDLKPLWKVPLHAKQDASILEHAHRWLLENASTDAEAGKEGEAIVVLN